MPEHAGVINQLVSSGIVHTPPPGVARFFLETVANDVEEPDRDIAVRMLPFPGTETRFLAARNWLSLTVDDRHRIWAEWWLEHEKNPYTKVIHVCGDGDGRN